MHFGQLQVSLFKGYNIYGAYQPDTIKSFSVGGKTYLVTANEGDAKVRRVPGRDRLTAIIAGKGGIGVRCK